MLNYFLILLHILVFFVSTNAENVCGDWDTYKEEKCIKLITTAGLQSFAEAEKTCTANGDSKIVSIHNVEKQVFLFDYLFTKHSIVDNVWLGCKWDSTIGFHWEDGNNQTNYKNWAYNNPKYAAAQTCVQMHAEAEIRGQWSNEPCSRMNRVVCEKRQIWTLNKMQELIERLMLNQVEPVPVGFIYVQLPKEKSPQEIWQNDWMGWVDISLSFNGVFFRVASGNAASFGTVQEEFSPYIDEIKFSEYFSNTQSSSQKVYAKISRNGGWTGDVFSAHVTYGRDYHGYLNFHTAAGEVRPKNMAVKVWKRTI